MNAVITGDVIKSTKVSAASWLETLKDELTELGTNPKDWEIYRGDSFQLFVKDAAQALIWAIKLKAAIKSQGMDIRIAIGLGEKSYDADRITESNGSAFVNSGEKFESLKKEKQNIAIKSDFAQFDDEINTYLKLGLIVMDNWTANSAEIVGLMLDNPTLSQEEIGKLIGIKQNAVSKRLKTARFYELMELDGVYKTKLKSIS
jgi:hypothetical protein